MYYKTVTDEDYVKFKIFGSNKIFEKLLCRHDGPSQVVKFFVRGVFDFRTKMSKTKVSSFRTLDIFLVAVKCK